jgi:hypothetical protein
MMLREIITVYQVITLYSENHIKRKNKPCGQNESNIMLKELV